MTKNQKLVAIGIKRKGEKSFMIKSFEKPGKAKKLGKTKAETDHLNLVASHSCMVCNDPIVCVHHVRISAETRNHFKTIPLCYDHHQGKNGIHHLGKKEFYKRFGHELDMLEKLNKTITLIRQS